MIDTVLSDIEAHTTQLEERAQALDKACTAGFQASPDPHQSRMTLHTSTLGTPTIALTRDQPIEGACSLVNYAWLPLDNTSCSVDEHVHSHQDGVQ